MFFERAALWGSKQGLEQGEDMTETRKGGEINPWAESWGWGRICAGKGLWSPAEAGAAGWEDAALLERHMEKGISSLKDGERGQDCVVSC